VRLLIPGSASGVGVAFRELALAVEFIGRLLVVALFLPDETLVMSGTELCFNAARNAS
jgi:hypothetical protein